MRIMKLRTSFWAVALAAFGTVGVLVWQSPLFGAEAPVVIAPPAIDNAKTAGPLQTAVLAGGCFWGVQGVYEHVRGVRKVIAGYAGGDRATAQYETVSSGTTGHAESVKIVFDPQQISYAELLRIYFSVATDPTQLNRQFPDDGPQYRGEVFYMTPVQKEIATRYIVQLQAAHVYGRPIVTRVDPFTGFYRAEDYHQDYLLKHPDAPYIATYDLPKVYSLKAMFPQRYRAEPVRS